MSERKEGKKNRGKRRGRNMVPVRRSLRILNQSSSHPVSPPPPPLPPSRKRKRQMMEHHSIPSNLNRSEGKRKNRKTEKEGKRRERKESGDNNSSDHSPSFLLPSSVSPESHPVEETCSICLEVVTEQGIMDSCSHVFCFCCILQWSEVTNICPLCKGEFKKVRRVIKGKEESKEERTKSIKIAKRKQSTNTNHLLHFSHPPHLSPWSSSQFIAVQDDFLSEPEEEYGEEVERIEEEERVGTSTRQRLLQRLNGHRPPPSPSRFLHHHHSSISHKLSLLADMFADLFQPSVLQLVLDQMQGSLPRTIEALLGMTTGQSTQNSHWSTTTTTTTIDSTLQQQNLETTTTTTTTSSRFQHVSRSLSANTQPNPRRPTTTTNPPLSVTSSRNRLTSTSSRRTRSSAPSRHSNGIRSSNNNNIHTYNNHNSNTNSLDVQNSNSVDIALAWEDFASFKLQMQKHEKTEPKSSPQRKRSTSRHNSRLVGSSRNSCQKSPSEVDLLAAQIEDVCGESECPTPTTNHDDHVQDANKQGSAKKKQKVVKDNLKPAKKRRRIQLAPLKNCTENALEFDQHELHATDKPQLELTSNIPSVQNTNNRRRGVSSLKKKKNRKHNVKGFDEHELSTSDTPELEFKTNPTNLKRVPCSSSYPCN